jgi:hypothetical protein
MRSPVKWAAGGVAAKFIRQARCSEARLPCPKSPRDARTGRKSTGTYEVVRTPARRFWTRLPVALRSRSNSSAIVSPYLRRLQADYQAPHDRV